MNIQVTMQVGPDPESVIFADEVASERLCSTVAVAESTAESVLTSLRARGIIRIYSGPHLLKCKTSSAEGQPVHVRSATLSEKPQARSSLS